MFDVSLGELLVIGAVTLVVVGPEKMPKVARTAGMLFGRLQRFVNNVKSDLQREIQASELAQIQKEIEAEAAEIKNTIHQPLAETSQALSQLEADFQSSSQQNTLAEPEALGQQTQDRATKSIAPNVHSSAPDITTPVDDKQLDLFAGLDEPSPSTSSSDRR